MSMNMLAAEAAARTGAIPPPSSKEDNLEALTKYIPTESITLYVAMVSAQAALATLVPWLTSAVAYTVFVVLTPALTLLLTLRKIAVAKKDWKIPPKSWPWWSMIAAMIAFAIWAMAVPGNPIIDSNNAAGGAIAGFLALVVSTLLNLISPFFEKKKA